MMRAGKYMIYSFYREGEGMEDSFFFLHKFFLPDTTWERKHDRKMELAQLKKEGYQIAGVLYVDKESYLNARLNYHVAEYIYEDNLEQKYKLKLKCGEITPEVFDDTILMSEDYKWTKMKQIALTMRRLMREDFEIENEVAIQLYDQYLKATRE